MAVLTDKHKRYDRQLRLWGDHGQATLEGARVCLINATATGTEILKNLILPGVGAFTIVDNAKVTASDLGANFFVTRRCLGKSRAECSMKLLQRLNEIKGNFIEDNIEEVLNSNPDFFTPFTIVIATSLPELTISRIAPLLWSLSIPLVVSKSYGMIGFVRIAVPRHEVVESHPDNYHEDLRLDCPFIDLVKFVEKLDIDNVDSIEQGNIPYLIVLYKYLQSWRKNHNGLIPQNFCEKQAFKSLIRSGMQGSKKGLHLDEENFYEAIQSVNQAVVKYTVPLFVQEILDNPLCTETSPEPRSKFWLLVRALREFVMNEGCGRLPVRGSIPDMTSNSAIYIDLSKVYQSQAKRDIEAFQSHLTQILLSLGKSSNYISEEEIRIFCRCSAFMRVLNYRSISEEFRMPDSTTLCRHFDDEESDIVYYVLLRAAEQFYEMYHFYPGDGVEGIEADSVKLKCITASLLQKWQLSGAIVHADYITEFCRYGAAEIHSVAAFVGGVAAQEVIKIITRQFIPLNNTWIYNAAKSSTLTFSV